MLRILLGFYLVNQTFFVFLSTKDQETSLKTFDDKAIFNMDSDDAFMCLCIFAEPVSRNKRPSPTAGRSIFFLC